MHIPGVIIEKVAGGYTVRGYSNTTATFQTHRPKQQKDPNITVGGISEDFPTFASKNIMKRDILLSSKTLTIGLQNHIQAVIQ